MANGLLLFMTDIDPSHESEFNRWYEEEHLAERMAIPGFVAARRFQALEAIRNIWRSTISNPPTFCNRRPIATPRAPASRPGPSAWKRCSSTVGAMSMSAFPSGIGSALIDSAGDGARRRAV
jgi:hypothetical protein